MEIFDSIGKNIQKIRIEKGLTEKEIADKIGQTTNFVKKVEAGKSVSLNTLYKISVALNTKFCNLFDDVKK